MNISKKKSKAEIEDKLGFELEGIENPKKNHILLFKEILTLEIIEWDEAIAWHLIMDFKFFDAFS